MLLTTLLSVLESGGLSAKNLLDSVDSAGVDPYPKPLNQEHTLHVRHLFLKLTLTLNPSPNWSKHVVTNSVEHFGVEFVLIH